MTRAGALLRIALRFPYEVVRSGWTISTWILRGREFAPGIVELPYGNLSETGAAIVSALISLTPGTTVIDVDVARGCLRIHVLDLTRAPTTLAGIEAAFLRPAAALFGKEA